MTSPLEEGLRLLSEYEKKLHDDGYMEEEAAAELDWHMRQNARYFLRDLPARVGALEEGLANANLMIEEAAKALEDEGLQYAVECRKFLSLSASLLEGVGEEGESDSLSAAIDSDHFPPTPPHPSEAEVERARLAQAITALLGYHQADEDGVMVLASRQAIHEVVDALRIALSAARPDPEKLAEIRERHEAWSLPDLLDDANGNWLRPAISKCHADRAWLLSAISAMLEGTR